MIDKITKSQIKPDLPEFRVGYTVKVDIKIKEEKRERIQSFEGIVIARKGRGVSETFTVRKKSSGAEKTFPLHSPRIAQITVIKKGKVRRAKLYFLRDVIGVFKTKERN